MDDKYTKEAEKLTKFRNSLNLNKSQFAKKLSISPSTIDYVERGERACPSSVKYQLLKIFGYDFDNDTIIFASTDAANRVSDNLISIPFYRVSAAAGSGIETVEQPERDTLYFDKRWLASVIPSTTDFNYLNCITASGDSMTTADNKGIKDNDLLFIDIKQKEINNGIYVILINNELRVKRLIRLLNNDVSIQSDNPHYTPEIYSPETSDYSISIIGRVVYNTSKGNV